jgi:hypothetical protein
MAILVVTLYDGQGNKITFSTDKNSLPPSSSPSKDERNLEGAWLDVLTKKDELPPPSNGGTGTPSFCSTSNLPSQISPLLRYENKVPVNRQLVDETDHRNQLVVDIWMKGLINLSALSQYLGR